MSGRRKHQELSIEDRILWSKVARSVEPMHGKLIPPAAEDIEIDNAHKHGASSLVRPITHPPYQAATNRPGGPNTSIDPPTRKKIAKGRLSIDASIDLHDLDQAEAHGILLAFMHRAHASGLRHVLVITGKGSSHGSAGVLKRAVPEWLKTPVFRGLVSGFDSAARHHGGGGAIYVRLRRSGQQR